MRINNKEVKSKINIAYSLAILLLLLGLFFLFVPIEPINNKFPATYFIAVGGFGLFVLLFFGNQHFEYDSDGEAINFKSSDVFFSKYSRAFIKSSDFPKSKLRSFKITGGIRKTLNLIITSKRSSTGTSKLKYNVTYLRGKDRSDLKRSLSKIVNQNRLEKENQKRAEKLNQKKDL